MRRLFWAALVVALLGAIAFYLLSTPQTIDAAALPRHTPDVKNGEYMFFAGGCSSCHSAPASAECADLKSADKKLLAGGRCFITAFGTFYAPNISPDKETGIGGWTEIQFVNAMMRGVSPDGQHLYPAFPYTSYQRMRFEDVLDLKAYMDTLPPVVSAVPAHDLPPPFKWRRVLGLWKLLFLDGEQFQPSPSASSELNRGAYLVNGPAHCGECHTPRNVLGGPINDKKLSGAPDPEGKGFVPNITPHKTGIGDWSAADIADSLATGFTPSFDSFGGTMVAVQENIAKLTDADRRAIAAYLKSVPPIASEPRKKGGEG